MVNHVYCHETGCPNTGKRKIDGQWLTVYTCPECGNEYTDFDEFADCCQPVGMAPIEDEEC
jgi:hypothetical protein